MAEEGPPAGKEKQTPSGNKDDKWQPKNWGFFKKEDVKKLPPQLKSKYLAYEDPPKAAAEAQEQSRKRLIEKKKNHGRTDDFEKDMDLDEKQKHEKLIGQLKAAEARNRIRIMRLRHEASRGQEVNHLIGSQSTARKAVRLQSLLPSKHDGPSQGDQLDKLQRARVEALLADSRGLLTSRS